MKSISFSIGLVIPLLLLSICNDQRSLSWAKVTEMDDESIDVEESDTVIIESGDTVESEGEATSPDDTGSSNVDVTVLFTKPGHSFTSKLELPAGQIVELLIGFFNKGGIDFTIETLDGSLRYPMDYTYHIQNFSTIKYDAHVSPGTHCTLYYTFVPSDSFASRPFGLSIGLSYKDEFGTQFYQKVYNETITIVEVEEGLDGETFFLYVFLCAGLVLLLVIGQQFLNIVGKNRVGGSSNKKQNVQLETGTKKSSSIDYDFIPKHMLTHINKPQKAVKQKPTGPKQRKTVKRTPGSDS